jgi:hypothetical protein
MRVPWSGWASGFLRYRLGMTADHLVVRSGTGCNGWPPWATLCPKFVPGSGSTLHTPHPTRPNAHGNTLQPFHCQGEGRGFESRRPLQSSWSAALSGGCSAFGPGIVPRAVHGTRWCSVTQAPEVAGQRFAAEAPAAWRAARSAIWACRSCLPTAASDEATLAAWRERSGLGLIRVPAICASRTRFGPISGDPSWPERCSTRCPRQPRLALGAR